MPATVSGCNPEPEVGVIAEQQWRAIQERRAAGMSVSGIARELDLGRKTVRTALKRAVWEPYRREVPAPTLLDEHRGWLVERAPQVHYSARILYQELLGIAAEASRWASSASGCLSCSRPMRRGRACSFFHAAAYAQKSSDFLQDLQAARCSAA
jgi:hypothetical protein